MLIFGLDQTATVYTPNATNGGYDVVASSNLACRLCHIQQGAAGVGGEREAIGTNRRLLWDKEYAMPDEAQVLVDGERWNVRAGTFAAVRGPDSRVVYRRCEVTKAIS